MADVIDPPPADRTGINGAGGQDARRLQLGMSTRQLAGQRPLVLRVLRVLDLTG